MSGLEGSRHFANVVTIDRTHVGETKFLKHSTHFGNRQPTHALFETIEFRWNFSAHEGEMAHALFDASRQELKRRA